MTQITAIDSQAPNPSAQIPPLLQPYTRKDQKGRSDSDPVF